MTMRKKDYEAIAQQFAMQRAVINATYGNQHAMGFVLELSTMAKRIAGYCATQDPTFKRDRFLADCGVQS